MRFLSILLLSMILSSTTAQEMEKVNKKIVQLFVASDNCQWSKLESIFAPQITLDYESMTGVPAAPLTPKQIIDNWKSILPGFDATHHQLGNFITEIEGNTAKVFCYGTATHYLPHKLGDIWSVIGTYLFELKKNHHDWQITKMTFNFKYQTGNKQLSQLAIENVKRQEP